MYYRFDSRMNLPEIVFEEDRITTGGKEYPYVQIRDLKITKTPLLATYGIFEIQFGERRVPIPFAKADLNRIRTAVQEAQYMIRRQRAMQEDLAHGADSQKPEKEEVPPVDSPGAEVPGKGLDPYEQVKKLKELLDLDIITREEFDRKKKELLDL